MPLIVHSIWPAPFSTAGQAVGHGQPQVVVAVHADHGLVDVRHALAERADHVAHVGRRGVADRVGNVDRRGAGVDGRFDHLAQEIELGARGVLGRELDVAAIAGRAAARRRRRGRMISCLSILSLNSRWMALVARKTWIRGARRAAGLPRRGRCRRRCSGPARRSPSRECSWRSRCTASKSPGEAMGKPASMMSTPRSTRAWATSIFSARFMLAPGDCSPSRSVVSKMRICFLLMVRVSVFVGVRSSTNRQITRLADPRSARATPTVPWPGESGASDLVVERSLSHRGT